MEVNKKLSLICFSVNSICLHLPVCCFLFWTFCKLAHKDSNSIGHITKVCVSSLMETVRDSVVSLLQTQWRNRARVTSGCSLPVTSRTESSATMGRGRWWTLQDNLTCPSTPSTGFRLSLPWAPLILYVPLGQQHQHQMGTIGIAGCPSQQSHTSTGWNQATYLIFPEMGIKPRMDAFPNRPVLV